MKHLCLLQYQTWNWRPAPLNWERLKHGLCAKVYWFFGFFSFISHFILGVILFLDLRILRSPQPEFPRLPWQLALANGSHWLEVESGRRRETRELLSLPLCLAGTPHSSCLLSGSISCWMKTSWVQLPTRDFCLGSAHEPLPFVSPPEGCWTLLLVAHLWLTSLFPLWLFSSSVTRVINSLH